VWGWETAHVGAQSPPLDRVWGPRTIPAHTEIERSQRASSELVFRLLLLVVTLVDLIGQCLGLGIYAIVCNKPQRHELFCYSEWTEQLGVRVPCPAFYPLCLLDFELTSPAIRHGHRFVKVGITILGAISLRLGNIPSIQTENSVGWWDASGCGFPVIPTLPRSDLWAGF
jgi:hypothetical protein